MGLLGILVALGLLIWLAYRGWSVLLLAPAAAILAAGLAGKPLLAHWTQTFMGSAARFLMQFFPIFPLGALFGKLMEDSGSVSAIANFMAERLGPRRACFRSYSPVPWSLMAASVFSSHSSCWPRWRMRCFAQPEALDTGGDRARHIDLYYVGAARNARDPERDPDAVFRYHSVRGARSWASSPRSSCLASAFGSLRALRLPRARKARAMGPMRTLPSTPRRIKSSASAQRRLAHSIRRRFAVNIKAMPLRPSRWLLSHSPSRLASTS
jgi:hypothetical protein